jgi:hypothetical protein
MSSDMKEFAVDYYKSGWYTAKVDITQHHINNTRSVIFDEIYTWMEKNIQGYRKHTFLTFMVHLVDEHTEKVYLVAKFRHQRDHALFVLRWV